MVGGVVRQFLAVDFLQTQDVGVEALQGDLQYRDALLQAGVFVVGRGVEVFDVEGGNAEHGVSLLE